MAVTDKRCTIIMHHTFMVRSSIGSEYPDSVVDVGFYWCRPIKRFGVQNKRLQQLYHLNNIPMFNGSETWRSTNNNNNPRTIFIVLSSWPLKVIARVHSVHLMNAVQRTSGCRPSDQFKPPDLRCESACRQLSSTTTIAIYYYYSAQKLILIIYDIVYLCWRCR